MAAFIKLEDSPMFLKQICSLEQTTEVVEERCRGLYKGCRKFTAALGEAWNGDACFADALEVFSGGLDDPIGVSIGGPVLSKFITAFRELAGFKELLRSQVEHLLTDRLMHFMNVDLQGVKESRRQFDKAVHGYDQARERFVSLKKNTREEVVAELEEELQNSRSTFERSRFNLVNALANVEARKKYEFLESISAMMDAHLRYFKLGYDLLKQMEPFVHQVLTYAQHSKEMANSEQDKLAKRIQEFRTQAELDSVRASSNIEPAAIADSIHGVGMSSYRNIRPSTRSSVSGAVQIVKQGYLLKRSSSLKGDWKRRFFVLDSQGSFYYYRVKGTRLAGSQTYHSGRSAEQNSSVFGRFRRHSRSASLTEDVLSCRTLDLCTSTIKMDADDSDLRLCFRIISPSKTYTLQAENDADRMEWVERITGAIASRFSSQFLQEAHSGTKDVLNGSSRAGANDHQLLDNPTSLDDENTTLSVSNILREIPGNDFCAECGAPRPDWASLNLGILLCIECSGVHRNLGVHISKVRSLTLDVKVWEPTILDLFRILGNDYCNSLWEGLLLRRDERAEEPNALSIASITKPCSTDSIHNKEKYIQAKYVERLLIDRDDAPSDITSQASSIWGAVKRSDLREVYHLIVVSGVSVVHTVFDDVVGADLCLHGEAQDRLRKERVKHDPSACEKIKTASDTGSCLQGCSLLHLACHSDSPLMLELLLQFGADVNMQDFHGRTPLHHCISKGNNAFAKLLLRRGARSSIKDGGGLSALERAMEMGAITDEELFVLLAQE